MFLVPYKLDTILTRLPISNIVIIVITTLMFFFTISESIPEQTVEQLILQDWDLTQMTGNALLHGNFFHLAGNMLFLWVFGNAICATVGNIAYPFLYLFLAVAASAAHLMFDGQPAIGASGAVNGIVGVTLVLFPMNKLHCYYAYSMPFFGIFWKSGKFSLKSYWMILIWFVFDLLGVMLGGGGIAYWAHIGGFAVGFLIALSLWLLDVVEAYDPTLLEVVTGKRTERTTYTLDDLAGLPGTTAAAAAHIVGPPDDQPVKPPVKEQIVAPRPAPLKDPLPSFRVLRTLQKNQDFYCYFVNEGDCINDVKVDASDPPEADFQPTKALGQKTPGWIRFGNTEPPGLKVFHVNISFANAAGKRFTKQLSYSEADGKIRLT